MDPIPAAQQMVDEAWRQFADGDLPGAIARSREAVAAGNGPAAALAALGFFLLQDGQVEQARPTLLACCENFPTYAPGHWYRGYLHQKSDDKEAAAQAFEKACRLDGSLDEAAYALAWVLHDLGRIEDAARWAQWALTQRRSGPRLLLAGWLMQQRELFEQAVDAYREAVGQFDPNAAEQPRLQLHLSQCLARLGRDPQARTTLEQALDHWPHDLALLAEYVTQRNAAGDPGSALNAAQQFVRHQPDSARGWYLLGTLHERTGQLRAADAAYERACTLEPTHVEALVHRAQLQRDWHEFTGARWLLDVALLYQPGHEQALDLLAQVLLDLDEVPQARRQLAQSLRARPRAADLWRLLAVAQQRRGRTRAARRSLARALALAPANIEALRMQGWLALDQGELRVAVDAVLRLLGHLPHDHAAQAQAALVLAHAGDLARAQALAEQAVAQAPDAAPAWRALSEVQLRQRRLVDAEFAARQAIALAPGQADLLRHLGWVLMAGARDGEAALAFLHALDIRPGDPVVRLELARVQARSGHFDAAIAGVDALLDEQPRWPAAMQLRLQLLIDAGDTAAPVACAQLLRIDQRSPDALQAALRLVGLGDTQVRALLGLVPAAQLRGAWRDAVVQAVRTGSHDSLVRLTAAAREDLDDDPWMALAELYAASLSPRSVAADLQRGTRNWYRGLKIGSGLAPPPRAPAVAGPNDHRPRIAYIASQPHMSLLRRVLAAHKPDSAEVFLYTNQPAIGLPSHVHVAPLDPPTLARSCAANRIDVVIDTGGLHPFDGQIGLLRTYARRLAPVQLGWLGCWGSAGGLFDGLLADAVSVPHAAEIGHDEAVFRLQGGQWCWDPPAAAPDPGPLPANSRGSITWGVTARSLKLSGDSLDAFARVVAGTPQSDIRFIGEIASDWPLRREVIARMQAHGVAAGRVHFDPFMPDAGYLAWLNRIDLVLDSFAGSGGMSLLDPLWMGVPVVTLAGDWAGARQGASLLASLGLYEWVASSADAFVRTAMALATNRPALSAHRAGLRARMQGSPLLDGRRVAGQIETLCARFTARVRALAEAPSAKAHVQMRARLALDDWLEQPRAIDLPPAPTGTVPDISVVVVLFNQAGLSQRMLQALADQRGVAFETIIVDNASSDRTAELLDRVRGARVIRNTDNRGFLRAARQGADSATGRFIAFLNSDANLQEGALAAAVATMDADTGIGALGGRVVLVDGGLQEAGNKLFRDGSAGGVGRGEDAFSHAARASRPTDYVSGVFLVTPATVWRMLGGFDDAFAPAYYEDTDYCLRVWRAGFRVVYEPSVLLEHLEWGSATGASATELMRRNQAVFCERHAGWLASQPRPQALSLDGDRWCSPDDQPRRARVLILENEVPHMARGGGLPRARLTLQALADWPVTLFPLWTADDNWRAVRASLPANIEVALDHGFAGLERFLERRRGVYDVLFVSRPPNLAAILPLRARRPELFAGMRLVYDAEALFALREIAMAAVEGRPLGVKGAREHVAREIALAQGASDITVVSERDARYYRAAGFRTHITSHSIAPRRSAPGVVRRRGLLFIGALHPGTPNEDGLLWFIEHVMPALCARLGSMPTLSVVGVCLSERVAALEGPHIRVLGPQQTLESHYDAARVFIAPVRFAGGVPAKVIEAAAHGIPVVASALLVRQLEWRDGTDIIGARDAQTFAAAVARLLDDDFAWARQQQAAWDECTRRYDPDAFARTLRGVLQGVA